MGAYFSLHDSAFWEQTIIEAPEPSIWSNVHFSPLSSHQRILLERPGRIYYSKNQGLRQGGVSIQASEISEVSLLVAFEEQVGRLYSAVLLRAPDSQLHRYGREVEEMVLTLPGTQRSPSPVPEGRRESPGMEMDKLTDGEYRDLRAGADITSLGLELIATDQTVDQERVFYVSQIDKGSWAERQNVKLGDEVPEINGRKVADMSEQDFKAAWNTRPIDLKLFKKENSMQETEWPLMLLYAVKEGVLVFFSSDITECEEVVREVALSFGAKTHSTQGSAANPSRTSPPGAGPGTIAAADLAAAMRVKCVEQTVGRAPPASTRTLTELIDGDLRRRFSVRCDPEEQPDCTNCAVFVLRIMMALQLAVRGYDIKAVCDRRSDLGPKAGETICAAWESLWRNVRP